MHLGVSAHHTDPADGGITQYTMSVFRALAERPDDFGADRLTLFGAAPVQDAAVSLDARFDAFDGAPPHARGAMLGRRLLGSGMARRAAVAVRSRLSSRRRHDPSSPAARNAAGDWLRERGVDVVYAPADNHQLLVESGVPSVITVHDIQHIRQPHFPEHLDGYFERVEYLLRNASRSATLIIAESETGKADLLEYYAEHGLTAERVAVVPYTVPPHLRIADRAREAERVRGELGLPERYVFYPAQFQPHKNHARLIEALGIIRMRTGERIPLVLSGAQSWPLARATWADVMRSAARCGVTDQVQYVGIARNEDMTGLYAGAAALVMPSFFGPTNIPLIEAWALGCPVVTSDIRGIREMCGDAALLVPPSSAPAIADAVLAVWREPQLAATLAQRGAARADAFSPAHFRDALWAALRTARSHVRAAS